MKRNNISSSPLFLIILFCTACASYEPFYSTSVINWQDEIPADSTDLVYSIFLVGDSRHAYTNDTLLSMMEDQLSEAGENSAVIFLGDNVHPAGLPDSTHKSWDVAHESLMAQLRILENYKGEVIFIPGYRDWAKGKKEGLEYVKNQILVQSNTAMLAQANTNPQSVLQLL